MTSEAKEELIRECVLFAYSHGEITEGAASEILGSADRLTFRRRWIDYLRVDPDIALDTGWEIYLEE